MKILLLESDGATALTIALHCQRFDHKVMVASSLHEARHLLMDSDKFDAMFCEYALPDGAGAEIVGFAKKLGVPTIAISDIPSQAHRSATREAGFIAHFAKPIDAEMINLMLAEVERLQNQKM